MIRLTEAQFSALRKPRSAKPRKALPALAKAHVRLKEADVVKACVGLMRAAGWDAIRLQSGVVRGLRGGHPITLNPVGTPDWLFMRKAVSAQWVGHVVAWYCEFKRPGNLQRAEQEQFMIRLRNRGMVAECFDNYESFAEFVRQTFGVK